MSITVLYYYPGQKATIFLETLDSSGLRSDGYSVSVEQVILPDLSLDTGYPQDMTKLDTGLYYFQFTIPTGSAGVGTYLIDVSYLHPSTNALITSIYQLVVNAPFGNYGTSIG
jgi:hypothetical protein